MTDPLFQMLANLPEAVPDRSRTARTRTRCHAILARGRPAPARRAGNGPRPWQGMLAGLGAVYLVETIRLVLRVYEIV